MCTGAWRLCWWANVFLVKAASSQRRAGANGLVSSGGRKCPAGEIQVCERQQREHLSPVLGDAAIAHLAIAELALNDAKHMLDSRAHLPGSRPIVQLGSWRECNCRSALRSARAA